jgi:uncharacterized protein YtpQ (UPF0354 family)
MADPLEDGQFRAEVLEVLRRVRPALAAGPHDDPAVIKIGNVELGLNNLYRQVRNLKGPDRTEEIVRFIDASQSRLSPNESNETLTFAQAKPRLRIQIAPAEYVGHAGTKMKRSLLHRSMSPYVVVAYTIDAPDTIQYVMKEQLTAWSADAADVHALAVANLEAASRDLAIEAKGSSSGSGRYALVSVKDGYAAARILCPDFVSRLKAALGSSIVLGIPNRDFLAAWTPDFDKRARFAAKIAEDFGTYPHPLSPELFVSDAAGQRLATRAELADHGRGQ